MIGAHWSESYKLAMGMRANATPGLVETNDDQHRVTIRMIMYTGGHKVNGCIKPVL